MGAGCHQSEEQKAFRIAVCEGGGGDVIGEAECGLFFFFFLLARRRTAGLEVTAGTGKRACPSPAVSLLRHGQMSLKDNLTAS